MAILYALAVLVVFYLLLTLILTYLVQQYPRRPVVDKPDWGRVEDTVLSAIDGKRLEVWRILPDGPSRGIVLFMHGWGRNRDRMMGRARVFARWGFTAVIHSARDHGNSSPCRFMNALKFAEDIESVLDWVGAPVLLYGHSAGAGGALIAAARNPEKIRLLFLEGCYARTREALLSLYTWVHPVFGRGFGPAILGWMNLFYRGGLDRADPCRLAFARRLAACFRPGQACLFIAPQAGHSSASTSPDYPAAIKDFLDRHGNGLNSTLRRGAA